MIEYPRIFPHTHYGRFYEIAEGIIVPSATTICRYGNPMAHSTLLYVIKESDGSVDTYYNKKTKALMDGNAVHQAIEDYENGEEVDFTNESREAKKGMISYICWTEQCKPKILSQEGILYSSRISKGKLVFPFAGRYDMVAEIDGEIWMLDAKTSVNYKDPNYMYQLSMYKMLYEEMNDIKIDRMGVIRCSKTFNGERPSPRTNLLYEVDYNPEAVYHLVYQFNMFYEQYDKNNKPKTKPKLQGVFKKC